MKQEEMRDEEAREQHRSDWIKAEYETMGWKKEPKLPSTIGARGGGRTIQLTISIYPCLLIGIV